VVKARPRLLCPGKDPVRIVKEAGWPQESSGRMQKILIPSGFDPLERPARRELIYRLSYPDPSTMKGKIFIYLFIFSGSAVQRGLLPPRPLGFVITHNGAPQSVGFLWTSDKPFAETST
jgi:hypothetical protein